MTKVKKCVIVHSETKNNNFAERNSIMKNMTSAIFYMSEWQAIFQCEEYSFSEARPFQDKQKSIVGLMT